MLRRLGLRGNIYRFFRNPRIRFSQAWTGLALAIDFCFSILFTFLNAEEPNYDLNGKKDLDNFDLKNVE